MPLISGIPLVELFDLTDTIESVLPAPVRSFVERFVVVGYSASHSDAAVFHRGSLQPIATAIDEIPTDFNIGIGRLSLPLLQTGIPFQLAFQRAAVTGNLEPSADVWRLDLSLDVFTLTVDGLEPAIYVAESGTTPRHLVRDTTRSGVRITGSAVLRIEKPAAGASVDVKFVDQPDPLDPTAPSGAVATLTCSPPHFFIGGSEFGLSVGRLQFDFSETYSTAEVLARNQGPNWMGVAIREATFYAPRNLPGLGDLSGGVKNVLIGSPLGLQGELEIQFGRSAMDPSAFQFEQERDGADLPLSVGGSGNQRTVTIEASQAADVTIRAGFVTPAPPADGDLPAGALQDWRAEWTWPDGSTATADSSSGTVRHGQVLRVTPIEVVTVDGDDTDFPHPDITFRFVAAGTGPTINARIGERVLRERHPPRRRRHRDCRRHARSGRGQHAGGHLRMADRRPAWQADRDAVRARDRRTLGRADGRPAREGDVCWRRRGDTPCAPSPADPRQRRPAGWMRGRRLWCRGRRDAPGAGGGRRHVRPERLPRRGRAQHASRAGHDRHRRSDHRRCAGGWPGPRDAGAAGGAGAAARSARADPDGLRHRQRDAVGFSEARGRHDRVLAAGPAGVGGTLRRRPVHHRRTVRRHRIGFVQRDAGARPRGARRRAAHGAPAGTDRHAGRRPRRSSRAGSRAHSAAPARRATRSRRTRRSRSPRPRSPSRSAGRHTAG